MITHKFQMISKVDKTKKMVLLNFQGEEMNIRENTSTIVNMIIFVVFDLLHFKSCDPLANRGPPILAGPPSQVPNKSLDAVFAHCKCLDTRYCYLATRRCSRSHNSIHSTPITHLTFCCETPQPIPIAINIFYCFNSKKHFQP